MAREHGDLRVEFELYYCLMQVRLTPPKFNMEPENDGFQKESPFPATSFQVPR